MSINSKVAQLLNNQIELEASSSFLYLAMSAWLGDSGHHGGSKYMYKQSGEEMEHMHKLFHYVNEAGGQAIVPAIAQPPRSYESFSKVFEEVYAHEQKVSEAIHNIVDTCLQEKDYTTFNFIQWYVSEQLEEENQFRTILDKLKMAGTDPRGIYMIDKELGKIVDRANQ